MLGNTQQAQAQTPAITPTGTLLTSGPPVANYTVGWAFTTTSARTITDLGVFDFGADGLLTSHQVGIWNTAGLLLASANVPAGTSGSLDGLFRYTPLGTPYNLSAGTYRIGAVYTQSNDAYLYNSGYTLDTGLTFNGAYYENGASLAYPTIANATIGYFSPNFKSTSTAAPEPGTLALITIGSMGIASRLRLRRK
jgi:Domain of unknown function (DUF4082)/PEP-CTERM motif